MKQTALFAALLLLFCALSPVAYAAEPKICGVNESFFTDSSYKTMQQYMEWQVGQPLTRLELRAGDELCFELPADLFADQDGVSFSTAAQQDTITAAHLSAGKVKAHRVVSRGNDLVQSVTLDRDGNLRIVMAEQFVSVAEREFECNITLSIAGKRQPLTTFRLAGVFTFDKLPLTGDDSYADISGGVVVEALDYIKKIDLYLGEGVTLTTNLFQGKKYYGAVQVGYNSEVLDLNPDIEAMYTLSTVNVSGVRSTVAIGWEGTRAWVYGEDGSYLGTTDKELPYSDVYYISGRRLSALVMPQPFNGDLEEPA